MENILSIIGEVLGVALVSVVVYLAPKLKNWLVSMIGEAQTDKLLILVNSFVTAAEQMYKAEDPDGIIRKDYVVRQLEKLGYAMTEELNAMIEAAVFELPKGGAK